MSGDKFGNYLKCSIFCTFLALSQIKFNLKKVIASFFSYFTSCLEYKDYFMESARLRYLRRSCWRIRKLTRSLCLLVRFLIQKQRVRKYRTKHFPCCNLFILYLLRFFNPNQISTLYQVMFSFRPSASTSLLQILV